MLIVTFPYLVFEYKQNHAGQKNGKEKILMNVQLSALLYTRDDYLKYSSLRYVHFRFQFLLISIVEM